MHKRIIVLTGLGILCGCAAMSPFRPGFIEYSATIEHNGDKKVARSVSWIQTNEHLQVENLALIYENPAVNGYTLRMWAASSVLEPTTVFTECGPKVVLRDFDEISLRLARWLPIPGGVTDVHFDVVSLAEDSIGKYEYFAPINETLTLRFAFRRLNYSCMEWWTTALGTLIHEYVHTYNDLKGRKFPNRVSEEAVAYTLESCALLWTNLEPFATATSFGWDNSDFSTDDIYQHLVAETASRDTGFDTSQAGKILSDFHFYSILGAGYPSTVSESQKSDVSNFCANVALETVDFTAGPVLCLTKQSGCSNASNAH